MAFSYKALIAAQVSGTVAQKQKALNDAGVRFNGNPINKNTMQGILLFQDKVSPAASQALREIERKFGKDVLTGGYVKLLRLCHVCERLQAMFTESHTTEQLVTYVIQFLEWGLRFEFIEPKNITVEGLDKGRDGSFGLVYLCLGRLHILGVVSCWVQDCKKVATAAALAGELETLLQHFRHIRSSNRHSMRAIRRRQLLLHRRRSRLTKGIRSTKTTRSRSTLSKSNTRTRLRIRSSIGSTISCPSC